jgi:hypothetical protein
MKVTEIIRGILDVIDGADTAEVQPETPKAEDSGYQDSDIKRFKQIVDLASTEQYSTAPQEAYADIEAVTNNAGADSMNGTKHPADIRGEHPSLYPGKVYGAQ